MNFGLVEKIIALLGAPLLSSFNGTGNELLDAVDSQVYWKVVGIEQTVDNLIPLTAEKRTEVDDDTLQGLIKNLGATEFATRQKAMAELMKIGTAAKPALEEEIKGSNLEVSHAARVILAKLNQEAGDVRLQKLLAIRTLGELKAEDAIPHLEQLKKSDELFVAEYAHRALAQIKGEEWTPEPAPPGTLTKDLAIVPASIQTLMHTRIIRGPTGFSMRNALMEANEIWDDLGKRGFKFPGELEPDTILDQLTRKAAPLLDRMGNIRIDSTTLAVPTDFAEDREGFVVVARGLWDNFRVAEDFKRISKGKEVEVKGVKWIRGEDGYEWMHLPSTTLAVYVTGRGVEPYVEAVSLRLSGEDKTPAGGPAVELAKRAPKDAPFVMAVVPTEFFLDRIPIFESLESVLSWHVPAGETGFAFKTFVKTDDAAKVKGMVSETTMMMAMGKGVLEMLGKTDKRLAPFPKMLESVKIKGEGDTLVAEAELPRMLDSHLGMIVALVSSALNFGR